MVKMAGKGEQTFLTILSEGELERLGPIITSTNADADGHASHALLPPVGLTL